MMPCMQMLEQLNVTLVSEVALFLPTGFIPLAAWHNCTPDLRCTHSQSPSLDQTILGIVYGHMQALDNSHRNSTHDTAYTTQHTPHKHSASEQGVAGAELIAAQQRVAVGRCGAVDVAERTVHSAGQRLAGCIICLRLDDLRTAFAPCSRSTSRNAAADI